ncbi:hypothetical protein SAJA_07870 [Salinisphaera japonica YTM-1]|uniref:Uncharacterized protein n=1 Tax=Salinisphaera japonica YTM-1 TaxID=1209778 RepID=A0A423PS73_9GAMM|nr:hypothetical protein SAJA_07870 [Salinisphaera japonica YTM-1]
MPSCLYRNDVATRRAAVARHAVIARRDCQ